MSNIVIKNQKIEKPSFLQKAVLSNDNRPKFSFSEKGKTYTAKNKNNLIGCCLQIDQGLYNDNTKKCDKGLILQDGRFFLIELKGIDVPTACKQIMKTLTLLKKDYSSFNLDFYARIISKEGVPKANTQRTLLEKQIGNKKLLIREMNFEENI